ncbi:amino acid permease [Aurantivibrio infirmus]
MSQSPVLARRINLPLLIFYGLGTVLGAGIYVLVGKVAGSAGLLAPLSFFTAALIAALTAMSYSKLVVLFPKSAGEAIYIENGFSLKWLTLLVGLLIILTGIVSSATLTKGFVGYFNLLLPLNSSLTIVLLILLMATLAIWGIAESLMFAAAMTIIEVLGLLVVLYYCGESLALVPDKFSDIFIPKTSAQFAGVFYGAFLAFYAFIGFEDMVNVVEEVKKPEVTMPRAILWVVILSTTLYVLISLVATLSLPLLDLVNSEAPLAEILEGKSVLAAKSLAVISVFAIVNGVLIQIIMASRVCYGMSKRYGGPDYLHYIFPATRTPIFATLLIAGLILVAALFLPLTTLAKATSFIILIIFSLVNLSLWKLKNNNYRSLNKESVKLIENTRSYPFLAAMLCLGLLLFQISSLFG